MKKVVINILGAIVLFLILMFLLNNNWIEDKYILNEWSINLPFYKTLGKSGTYSFETIFDDVGFDTLVLPKISGNILKVYLNKKLIYTLGTKTSNIWSRVIVLSLNKDLIKKENNVLEIEIFGLYDIGVHKIPFLTTYENSARYSVIMNFLRGDIYLISLGISLISGIISFIFSFGLRNKKEANLSGAYKSFGVFLILISIYLFDYQFRLTSFNDTLFFSLKKLFMISAYLSVVFYLYGIETYRLRRFVSKWMLYIIFPIVSIIIISSDFPTYVKLSPFTNLLFVPLLIYILIRLLILRMNKLYFSAFFASFAIIQTILALTFSFPQFFTLGYAIIAVSIGVIVMLSSDYKMLSIENYILSKKSLIDPLTGSYNRNILTKIKGGGYFILIDLDNFKNINDTHGHEHGDVLLKEFVKLVKNNIRQEDFLVRLGGDEFAIITKSSEPENLVERLQKEAKDKLNLEFSYGIVEYTEFSETYRKADEKLYNMKKFGKRTIF